jgi:hypothetical protein
MGGKPSHPELLDWLAAWFRDDARGSLKQLHRLIVTSATYRQSSAVAGSNDSRVKTLKSPTVEPKRTAANPSSPSTLPLSNPSPGPPVAEDSDNRLLWRMNRTRLDAEQVRDTILLMAGCLDLRMGGPSDMQFDLQPGIHVTPRVDYTRFNVDSPLAHRRSVYRFLFRTLPDPFMDALDCPAGDQLTPVRNASVTVQQALAMWNDAFATHYAARFAERLQTLTTDTVGQIARACELALNRSPAPAELSQLTAYAEKHGLANLCRLLLNSNEFMFVN